MFGAIAAFLTMAGIYYVMKDPKYLREFEKKFENKYRLTPTIPVPLNVEEVKRTYLHDLCKKYVKKKKLNENPPYEETQWLGFKKITGHIIRIELIRCSEDLAIITADEYFCAYLLQKTKKSRNFLLSKNDSNSRTIFTIKAKFCFGDELMIRKYLQEKRSLQDGVEQSPKAMLFGSYVQPPPPIPPPTAEVPQGILSEDEYDEMNHSFPIPVTHDAPPRVDEEPTTASGRQIYYPAMENLGTRNVYQRPGYQGGDVRLRGRQHPSDGRGEQPLPQFETYRKSADRRPSNADDHHHLAQ